jgi:hypothetical protein
MGAHTTIITTNNRSRPRAWRRALVLGLAVCSLVVPATASASPIGSSSSGEDNSTYSSVSAITGQPTSSADDSTAPSSGYSSVSSITGPPASEPTFVSGGSSDPADGFDWASAAVGAGTVLALGALCGATLLTVRRRTATATSVSTG